jgi:vacuolar protein sorting-associated protein 13A/C
MSSGFSSLSMDQQYI